MYMEQRAAEDEMIETMQEAREERVFDAPRLLVWGLLADTNRFDRAYGLKPAAYAWRERGGRRERVGKARELGFDLVWVEPPYQWVEGASVHGERLFESGPIDRGGFRVEIDDVEGGTRVRATAYMAASRLWGRAVSAVLGGRQKRALRRFLDAVEDVLSQARGAAPRSADEPAVAWSRRVLDGARYQQTTAGPRTPVDPVEFEARAERMRASPVDGKTTSLLLAYLRDRPDEEVAQLRPFELARTWGSDRREALRGCLHATRAGLLDLQWRINCPVCRVAAVGVGGLSDMTTRSHCDACNLDYEVDLAAHVEAAFHCNTAVRRVETPVYCASSPAFLPHVIVQRTVAPGETLSLRAPLAADLHVRTLQGHATADVSRLRAPASLEIHVDDHTVRATASGDSEDPTGEILVTSSAPGPVTLLVERAGWSADVVLGTVLLSFPEFLDLFATEAPATGVDLRVGEIAVLFTDLTGSTALYERVGDARAFAMVHEHFRLMTQCVARHGGAVVKTMGDAVMATFSNAPDAVRAALDMVGDNAKHVEQALSPKVGVHVGPCLMVRANDRLDYFGSTVNVAARLQGQARAGQVVLAQSTVDHPGVSEVLQVYRLATFDASLKGIGEHQRLVAVDVAQPM
jgi:class 3 adenylate cyclase